MAPMPPLNESNIKEDAISNSDIDVNSNNVENSTHLLEHDKYSKSTITIPSSLSSLGPPKRFPRNWMQNLLSNAPHPTDSSTILKNKALVVAPMVDQSDLPFRLLCRSYGANLCFTPMIHAKMFMDKEAYHHKFWNLDKGTPKEDRPLIAQFCGSDPHVLYQAASMIQHQVDAIDLNCGCPQTIAKRGRYGAFLLENAPVLISIVRTLASQLDIPVTVKVRLLPSGLNDSLNLYKALVDAGASMITVHGRNRFQKGQETGPTDWDAIAKVVSIIGHGSQHPIPILANGSISNLEDVKKCLLHTNADGVMSSEAVLEYPAIFLGEPANERTIGRIQLAKEFLALSSEYPPEKGGQGSGFKCCRVHLHRILHADLQNDVALREQLITAKTYSKLHEIVKTIEEKHLQQNHSVKTEEASWYMRHRILDNDFNVPKSRLAWEKTKIVKCVELDDETAQGIMDMFGDNEACWG